MAKPIAVTLPFVLLLLDAWPLRRLQRDDDPRGFDRARIRRALTEKWPLFALAVAASVVTLVAQRSGGALASLDHVALGERIANALVAYTAYLGKTVWPSGLAVFYPHPEESLPWPQVAMAAAFLVGVTVLALVRFRRAPGFGVGWLWYLGTLVPVIGLVQVGSQAMADRYMYLPLVGLAIAVAWGVPALVPTGRARTPVLSSLAVVTLAALAGVASLQLRHWRDSRSLFEHAVRVTADNHVAHAYLGAALLDEGRTEEGVARLSEAVRLQPSFLAASNNLAWVLATSGDDGVRNPVLAVPLAQRAAAITGGTDPDVLDTLAAAYAAAGRFEEAVQAAERAVALAAAAGPTERADAIQTRLDLYRERRAYRDPSGEPSAP
jgi:tetratricopeptide (TPR) repeat protein